MATFKQVEEIQVWQKARALCKRIYSITNDGRFSRDFVLCDQIRRAGVSVISNIAEGFERGGTKEFAQFLAIAKGSAGEMRAQLYVALDQDYIDRDQFEELINEVDEVSKMINGLLGYLRRSGIKGTRFRR
jgi:four helix bundle protein